MRRLNPFILPLTFPGSTIAASAFSTSPSSSAPQSNAWVAGVIVPPVILVIGLVCAYFFYKKIKALVDEARALRTTDSAFSHSEQREVSIRELIDEERGLRPMPMDEIDAGDWSPGSSGTGTTNKRSSASRSSITLPPPFLLPPLPFAPPKPPPKPKSRKSLSGSIGSIARSRRPAEVGYGKDGRRVLTRKSSAAQSNDEHEKHGRPSRTRRSVNKHGTGENDGGKHVQYGSPAGGSDSEASGSGARHSSDNRRNYYDSSASLSPPSSPDFRNTQEPFTPPPILIHKSESSDSAKLRFAARRTTSYGATTSASMSPVVSYADLTPTQSFSHYPKISSPPSRSTPTPTQASVLPKRTRWSSADVYSDHSDRERLMEEDENIPLQVAEGRILPYQAEVDYFGVDLGRKMYSMGAIDSRGSLGTPGEGGHGLTLMNPDKASMLTKSTGKSDWGHSVENDGDVPLPS